ncbi:MAG: N-acyl homoserine lactonase family protein [Dehalobacterium sp.]
MTLKIRPIKIGAIDSFEKSKFTYGANFGVKLDAPCLAWIIEGAQKKILVDSGPCDPEFAEKYHSKLKWEEDDFLENRLSKAGVNPQDIDLVILTHLHWDHCFSLHLFENAKFLVQKKELQYAISPLPVHKHAYEAQVKGVTPPWFNIYDRMIIIDGDFTLEPGLEAVLLPGHTPGLQGLKVETKAGRGLIASDFLPLFENWYNPSGHIPSGIHVNLEDCYKTFKKIEQITDWILPGHDPEVLKKEVYGD